MSALYNLLLICPIYAVRAVGLCSAQEVARSRRQMSFCSALNGTTVEHNYILRHALADVNGAQCIVQGRFLPPGSGIGE